MLSLRRFLIATAEGASILALGRLFSVWWALALVVGLWLYWRQSLDLEHQSLFAIGLVSLALVLSLNHNLIGQLIILAGYVWWRSGLLADQTTTHFDIWQAAWLEFISISAIFSAEAIWHWPLTLVLVSAYVSSVIIAYSFFGEGERATRALSAAWGLIVAESSYVFSIWLVHYVLPGNILLIPQAAVVLTALGYCFGSIYLAHTSSKLSKARLAEYAIIGLCLIVIVIAGTKWSGSV
ncbi:MAG TPA: hypothetical protein VLE72_01055 [Candidatus Saccharimonadales bacterium]|nr:hypothetical protein [Candidatus Saccharimonadales bacterium]